LTKLIFIFLGNVIRKQKTEAVIQRILVLFAENSIDVMLVKGAAKNFSHIYDQAWYTVSDDVDLVIKQKRDGLSKAQRQILFGELDMINHTPDPHVEHFEYDFFEHHDVTMNNIVKIDSNKIWQDGHQIQVCGQPVYIMSIEDMLIATGINASRKRYFKLKNLLDISAIVRKNPDMDWERFIDKTHEYHCDNIIYTALFLAQRILGIIFPVDALDDLKVNQTRKTLINKAVDNSLSQRSTLLDLVTPSEGKVFGRALNRSLFLTYVSYTWDQIGRKLIQLSSPQWM